MTFSSYYTVSDEETGLTEIRVCSGPMASNWWARIPAQSLAFRTDANLAGPSHCLAIETVGETGYWEREAGTGDGDGRSCWIPLGAEGPGASHGSPVTRCRPVPITLPALFCSVELPPSLFHPLIPSRKGVLCVPWWWHCHQFLLAARGPCWKGCPPELLEWVFHWRGFCRQVGLGSQAEPDWSRRGLLSGHLEPHCACLKGSQWGVCEMQAGCLLPGRHVENAFTVVQYHYFFPASGITFLTCLPGTVFMCLFSVKFLLLQRFLERVVIHRGEKDNWRRGHWRQIGRFHVWTQP